MTRWTLDDVARMRLLSHRLVRVPGVDDLGPLGTAVDVVRHLGCVQAQDLSGSTTSIALRTTGRSLAEVHAAYDAGEIVRSWPMRGTLFAVAAEDLDWMLSLTSEGVLRSTVRRRAELGLTDRMLERSEEVARAVLGARDPSTPGVTRAELLAAWTEAGLPVEGGRGYHQIFHLAVRGVLCQGPMQATASGGAEQRFVLVDRWIGDRSRVMAKGEAVAEWFGRYARSHGPVAEKEFLWWTKLLRRDLAPALDAATEGLTSIDVDGTPLWVDPAVLKAYGTSSGAPGRKASVVPLLLPGFDELVLGYGDRSAIMTPEQEKGQVVPGKNGVFRPTLTHRGRALGTWTRPTRRGEPVAVTPFEGALAAGVAKALPRLTRDLPA